MAFAKSTQARLPHFPGYPGTFTTLQTSFHNADRPVAPPRFDPGLSTGPGSFTTEDLGVSPDRTFTGWLTRVIARLRHDHSFAVVVIAPEQLDARGSRLKLMHLVLSDPKQRHFANVHGHWVPTLSKAYTACSSD